MARITADRARFYRELADRFARENNRTEYELREVIAWASERDLLHLCPADLVKVHTDWLSDSLRSDTTLDVRGRKVRLRHCVKTTDQAPDAGLVQRVLWAHIDEASDRFLMIALQQRRDQIRDDAEALRADLDYINVRRALRKLEPIQLDLNFNPPASPDAPG